MLACIVGAVAWGYWAIGGLALSDLAHRESQLRALQERYPVIVYAIAFLAYVIITGLSIPGATAMTLAYGWYFGFLRGIILVSFSSTTGATLAFLLSRFLFRDLVQRHFGERLHNIQQAVHHDGAYYLLSLRLIPAVPFFIINAVMGLTPIRTRTFWWVSQLGMLPSTVVYVYAGATVPSLQELADRGLRAALTAEQIVQLLVALVLLGVLPIASRWAVKRIRRSKPG